jgi:DNA-directed RNA polymerase subunit RPC12/RpoP
LKLRITCILTCRCAKCGKQFAISQDVTKHTRENECSRNEKNSSKNFIDEYWKCTTCPFTSDSEAEFLFHKALHDGVVKRDSFAEKHESTSAHKFQCPLCDNIFNKSTLRDHIRRHTGERPFPCGKCFATFIRRSAARIHQKECSGKTTAANLQVQIIRERNYVCSECSSAFHTKLVLTNISSL